MLISCVNYHCVGKLGRMTEELATSHSPKKKQKVSQENSDKWKILCIHGYRQNGDVFKQKTGALRKMLKKHAEFVFVTAPMRVPPLEPSEPQTADASSNLEQYGWWFSDENNGFNSKKPSEVCIGFTKSLEVITNTFKESGPFDGLLGFSQGASFVSVLCGMHERGCLPFSFKFAILIAGFRSLCSPHYKNYLKTIRIPTLHVYGETDQIIPKEMSEELTSYFLNPEKMVHSGGHYVPASGKDVYIKFLEEGIWEVMEEEECEENDSVSECNDETDDSET